MNDRQAHIAAGGKRPQPAKGMATVLISLAALALLALTLPDKREALLSGSMGFLKEVALIMPAICVLMGLFGVFVSKDFVMKVLGKSAGWKGIIVAIGLGSLPTGPLYAAFPLAAALREKGARDSNIFLFLTAWACIKLPQELLELRFLGLRFMIARLALTIGLAIPAAFLVEYFMERRQGKATLTPGGRP
jgi:uncharacterized membrane protein YraQ (UPF0718 family)